MKKYFSFLAVIIFTVFISFKKEKNKNTDGIQLSTKKNEIITAMGDEDSSFFANGSAFFSKFKSPFDVSGDVHSYIIDPSSRCTRKVADNSYRIVLDESGNLFASDLLDRCIQQTTSTANIALNNINTYDVPGLFVVVQETEATMYGSIHISNAYDQLIRRISAVKEVNTITGIEKSDLFNRNETGIRFNNPRGVAIDKQGNLYVPDPYNFCIRKITPYGQVSTFAGNGICGHTDGDAARAQFSFPADIVIDSIGNLFVSDGNCIRKISPQGFVSTITGHYADGNSALAKFYNPSGLGIDSNGNIYVADAFNNRIRKISLDKKYSDKI